MKEFWNSLTPKKQKVIKVFAVIFAMSVLAVMIAHGVNAPVRFND